MKFAIVKGGESAIDKLGMAKRPSAQGPSLYDIHTKGGHLKGLHKIVEQNPGEAGTTV